MALDRLAALDRRLPFGTATLVGATALGVLLSGTSAALLVDGTSPSAAAAPASNAPVAAAGKPAPPKAGKPAKPATPEGYLLDVSTLLPGYRRLSDRIADAGAMGLEEAARIEAGGEKPTDEDREVMRELGFVRGHSRAWTDGDATVVVLVYEWKDADGPLTFVRGMQEVSKGAGNGWVPPMRRAHGVCGVVDGKANDSVLAAVGKHSFLLITLREGGCATHEPVTTLVREFTKNAAALGA